MKSLNKNNFKRILACVLALSLIFSLGITNIAPTAETSAAAQTSAEWDGTIAENYADGTGAENDPYLIANGAQLAKLVNDTDTSGKYYKLTADIVLNDSLTNNPTQWYSSAFDDTNVLSAIFAGVFDGNGHTVSGLYFNGAATNNTYWFAVGLFPHVAVGATIKNVGLINSSITITGGGAAGSIVGMYKPASSNDTAEGQQLIIRNCFADSTVSISAGNVGGIAGGLQGSAILYDCYFTGNVSATSNKDAIYGLGWSNAVHVYNFYTTVAIVSKARNQLHDSAYTTVSNSAAGIVTTEAKITAWNATATFSGFDFDSVWMITSTTPILRVFYKDEAAARANAGVWTGEIATAYADGTGAETDPYLIANGEQLAKLVNDTETTGKYYKLTADIVLNKTLDDTALPWYVTCNNEIAALTTAATFSGNFDGDGHTVSGLYLNTPDYGTSDWYGTGLIPWAGANATIENVGVINSSITVTTSNSRGTAGAIAGYIKGDSSSTNTIKNCYADESVSVNAHYAGGITGAIVGYALIENCYFTGNVSGTTAGAFGARGWTAEKTIRTSYTTSAVVSFGKTYFENVYSTVNTVTNAETGQTAYLLDKTLITGWSANKYLTNFDFTDTWGMVSGSTPVLRVFFKEKADKGIWTGLIAGSYAGGDGTAANPYKIANGEQLAKLAKATDTAGKYYVLTADIKLNDMESDDLIKWFTVYNSDVMFQGNFNGKGHTISGLYYNATTITDGHRSGLFPVIGAGAVVTNISFESCDMSVGCYGGTVAGYSDVKANEVFPEISYINVEESVSIKGYSIGGVVGGGTIANFDNCCFTGTLTGVDMGENTAKRNGIVGNFWGVGDGIFYRISNCYTWKYAPFNYENVLAVCSNVYSGTTETVGGTIGGKTTENVKADAMNQLPNLNWKDVWAWEEGSMPCLKLNENGSYNSYELGDTDCSGEDLNAADLTVMRKHLLGTDFAYNADLTKDGKVSLKDLVSLKKLSSVA